ncbi:MAG: leucine-rich repeat domain-containing protein [Clostridia bacterium]|nr:leucine-rich repeat domain-containing protein [Clostridia bacterium]
MKKSKLKKILASSAMGIMALAMPFALTGCDKKSDINVRVDGEYVQWQVEGEDSWTNLLSIDEIKDLLGDALKGEQGNPGMNGKEVEFRKNETHIQWRYITEDDSEEWTNLIAISELKGNKGDEGDPGKNGSNGLNGSIVTIGEDGYWYIDGVKSDVKAKVEDGNGIKSITIDQSNSDATKTTYIITFDNNKTYSYVVKNGTDGIDTSVKTYDVALKFTTPSYWKTNSLTSGCDFSELIFEQDILNYTNYTNNLSFSLEEGYTYNSSDDSFHYNVKSNEWIGEKLPDFKGTEFEEYFVGWFVKGTDIEISQFSFIGGNVGLELRWDEENMSKYFSRGVTFLPGDAPTTCTVKFKNLTPNANERKFIVIPQFFKDDEVDKVVNCIGSHQYENPETIRNVIIPTSITTIDDKAFYNCSGLGYRYGDIIIPSNVSSIGESAFEGSNVDNLYIMSKNVNTIGNNAFKNCTDLQKVWFAEKVKSIGDNVFSGCSRLTSIILPEGLENLGSNVFAGSGITSMIVDSTILANSLDEDILIGSIVSVYIKESLEISNSIYLLENFIKQSVSDKSGYSLWTR